MEGWSPVPGDGPDKHRVCCAKQRRDQPRPVRRRPSTRNLQADLPVGGSGSFLAVGRLVRQPGR